MRSFIQHRLGGTEYPVGVYGTSRSELRRVYAIQAGRRSYGLIDSVQVRLYLPILTAGGGRNDWSSKTPMWHVNEPVQLGFGNLDTGRLCGTHRRVRSSRGALERKEALLTTLRAVGRVA
jgi:hypothetical protein